MRRDIRAGTGRPQYVAPVPARATEKWHMPADAFSCVFVTLRLAFFRQTLYRWHDPMYHEYRHHR